MADAQPNVELILAIRELTRVTADLERVESDFRGLMDALEEGVVMLDAKGRVMALNGSAVRLLGAAASAVPEWVWGQPATTAHGMHPAVETLLDGKPRSGVALKAPGDGARWLAVSTRATRSAAGEVSGVVCSFSDVTERRMREETLEKLATVDPLTGAFNRRYVEDRLEAEISRARRSRHPLAFALADLDHFKGINDRHGHAGGDRALQAFATTLRETLRLEDVVARLGGDEFCMLFPGTGAQAAAVALERVLARLRATDIAAAGATFRISATFGVAELKPGTGRAEFMAEADAALYLAKEAGRGRVAVHRRDGA